MTDELTAYSITDPLPTGTTLLEASAGTGKTWTIAALVARYVAEQGLPLDELLVVTFTRAASQELRDRVREQLVAAQRALADPPPESDRTPLTTQLLDCDADERAVRLRRLTQALADFDAATIATIHQFCQLVLRSLGVAGDTDRQAELVEDLDQLTTDVVDDVYLAWFADDPTPAWSRIEAEEFTRAVVTDPRASVQPEDAVDEQPDSVAARRVRFARAVLHELEVRKRRLGVLSFDDLLGQLADALEDPRSPARSRMRQRWRVALIDEFQDTDPVQWQVFERAFAGAATLVLIGDPKQAIYAFRGGDVTTYLQAARSAATRQTLGVNWRSDRPLVDALQAMLGGSRLGHPEIVVRPVDAHHGDARLVGAGPPVRLRVARRAELGAGPRAKVSVDRWRDHVVTDLARDVKRLLTGGATVDGRPVQARDIAVLAYTHTMLQAIQRALAEVGVPAVVTAGGSVFHSPAAAEWLSLLEALEQPHRSDRVRAAALTSFIGLSAAELDAGGDALTDDLADRAHTLARLLADRGVAAVLEHSVVGGLNARVLTREGGERLLTDLRHLGEALHRVSVEERFGVVGLLGWLREQVAEDKVEVASERARRLDSDAAAVQLVTIHGSKGLEYPVVYLPSLWDRFVRQPDVPRYHDDAGRRCRDVGGPSPWHGEAVARHQAEDAGESLRLLYVALTRAACQVVAWYCPSNNTPASALHRVLFGRRPGDPDVPDAQATVEDDRIVEILGHWRDAGALWPELAVTDPPDLTPLPADSRPLSARSFDRAIDTEWRRSSYSSLSAAHDTGRASPIQAPLSEPEPDQEPETADIWEPDLDLSSEVPDLELAAVPSPMADLPAGAAFGSLVHAVLEHADLQADDLRGELLAQIHEQGVWWPVEVDADDLAGALALACTTPLGALVDDRALVAIPPADRLAELDFELPLAGGDLPVPGVHDSDEVVLGDLAPLLRRHLRDKDPVLPYADALDADPDLAAQPLRGYLTGSIDVVMRVGAAQSPRFVTVDYKTNRLGDPALGITAWDYRPAALDEAMAHSDYPLQALLYTAVLHRFLRWRLPGYDPATHLGGVLYLYLRGLCGPDTPTVEGRPAGVFAWRAPVALVEELSDLLDGVRPVGRLGRAGGAR